MKTKYKWAWLNKQLLRNIARLLHTSRVANMSDSRIIGKTKVGATHKVRASGLGGWTRKMNRARA
jgi:hypothetical protein